MDIGAQLARLDTRLKKAERSSRLSSASLDGTALEARDDSGGLRAIVGQQADGTSGIQVVNGPPPPAPSAPIVASVLGGVTVSWDGAFTGGAVIPLDWSRIEVHASATTGFTPIAATLKSTIETAQGATVVVVADTPVYVRLLARNTSGAASPSSSEAGPFGPTPVVADGIVDGIVTEAKLADEAVTAAKVRLGAIGADQLALGIGNLAPDPSFEGIRSEGLVEGLPDWSIVTPGNNSPKALHVNCTSGSTTWKNIELGRLPVLPGERHYLALDFKASALFNGSGIKLMFRYENATATVLGYGVADKTVVPGGAWDHATNQVQAPTGATTAVLLVEASSVSAGEAWFDNLEVRTLIAAGMIAANTITANELTTGAVTTTKLDALAVTAEKVAAAAITTAKLDALAVTSDKLAANSVIAGKISAGTVDATAISAGAITTAKLSAGAVDANAIAANAVTTAKLAAGAVDATAISAGAITTAKLAAGAVDATALKADAITGKTITGGTITGTDITGGTITGGVLQTNTSGSRVVVTPSPPAGMAARPTALFYSGVTGEQFPAGLNSGPNSFDSAQGTTALSAPITAQDGGGNYTYAGFAFGSPKAGTSPGRFTLTTNAPNATSELGHLTVDAQSATTATGTSSMTLYAKNGTTNGKQSTLALTGASVTVTADSAASVFNASGLTIPGTISARNTPSIIVKTSSTDRASNITLTDDPDFITALVANATYLVELHLYVGAGAGLMTTAWSVPSGSTGIKGVHGAGSAATEVTAGNNNADNITGRFGAHGFTTTVTYGRRNVNTNLVYSIEAGTVTTTTAGNFSLQWAQSTSSATNTRMGLGSWMRVTRIA